MNTELISIVDATAFVREVAARSIPLILDTETDGLEVISGRHRALWLGLTPAAAPHFCAVVKAPLSGGAETAALIEALNAAMLVGHNIRFDLHALGLHPWPPPWDTMLRIYSLDTSTRKSLDDVAPRLGLKKVPTPELIRKGRIAEVPDAEVIRYLADDCGVTARIYLDQAKRARPPVHEEDCATEMAVLRMERRGVRLLREPLAALSVSVDAEIAESTAALVSAGFPATVNINSPAQVKQAFERRGVALPKDRDTGRPSTGKMSMEILDRRGDPMAAALLRARKALKLRDAFLVPLGEMPDLIHASVKTAHTKTGRFSYERPNLQQVPKRGKLAKLFRNCFTAASGRVAGADYSQQDLRVATALCKDPRLLEMFAAGKDIHRTAAAQILGKSPDAVTAEERSKAKATTLGLLNGMGAARLAHEIQQTEREARRFLDAYFRNFCALHEWMEGIWRVCETSRMAKTVADRYRMFGRDEDTRPGLSVYIQGGSGEIMRAALRAVDEADLGPILTVHDEILCDGTLTTGAEVASIMKVAADNYWKDKTGELPVSFEADGFEGATWGAND